MTIDRLASSFGVSTVSRDLRRNASEKRLSSRKFLPIIEDCADQHSGGGEKRRQTSRRGDCICEFRAPPAVNGFPGRPLLAHGRCQESPGIHLQNAKGCLHEGSLFRKSACLQATADEMERSRF